MDSNERKLSQKDFIIIRDLIKERTGIFIRDTRIDYLEYRVNDRMIATGINSIEEYYFFLKYSPTTSGEFQQLINLITVHETSFFRNPDQLRSFREVLLKDLLEKKRKNGERTIKIWSAACSTGEEPVTLGIILNEVVQSLSAWTVQILATDISTRALSIARKGAFPTHRFTDVPQDIVSRYFTKVGEEYVAKDLVSNLISYTHMNLTHDIDMNLGSKLANFDFIFCRNVFIYFPDEIQEKIASRFLKALTPGGYVLLGNAESIDVRKVPFAMKFYPGGMVYQKPVSSVRVFESPV